VPVNREKTHVNIAVKSVDIEFINMYKLPKVKETLETKAKTLKLDTKGITQETADSENKEIGLEILSSSPKYQSPLLF